MLINCVAYRDGKPPAAYGALVALMAAIDVCIFHRLRKAKWL